MLETAGTWFPLRDMRQPTLLLAIFCFSMPRSSLLIHDVAMPRRLQLKKEIRPGEVNAHLDAKPCVKARNKGLGQPTGCGAGHCHLLGGSPYTGIRQVVICAVTTGRSIRTIRYGSRCFAAAAAQAGAQSRHAGHQIHVRALDDFVDSADHQFRLVLHEPVVAPFRQHVISKWQTNSLPQPSAL